MAYPFRNLIFEGGGVKGIAYVGAMEVLTKEDILSGITRVGGASAGAINAMLIGLGYSIDEFAQIMKTLDFNFLDDTWGVIRDTARLIDKYGWYRGDFFRSWAAGLIKEKTGNSESTFKEIYDMKQSRGFRDIYMMGTNLSTRFSEVFSYEHTPRIPLADAVRISMSIPLFCAAKRNFREDVYVDGGLLDNYPIKLFDREKYVSPELAGTNSVLTDYYTDVNRRAEALGRRISQYVFNKETLGFRLDSKEEIALFRDQAEPPHRGIDDFFGYAWALIETVLESQASQHLHSDDWQRTIYIDTLGVKTTDFSLDDTKKDALTESGRNYTRIYLKWYNDPDNSPVNRV
jgi:NTE family protein